MAVSSNRLSVAPELFSEELITFECYRNIVEGSSKTEEEKATALMIIITDVHYQYTTSLNE